jgi:outer membrane protein assembly factor BamB/LysM repeat protein
LKSRTAGEKDKVKRESITSFVSTKLLLRGRKKLKGNKMIAILAILLMLGGVLFVPRAFSGSFPPYDSPVSLVTSSIVAPLSNGSLTNAWDWTTNASFKYPTWAPGNSFYVWVDVINVTQLLGYQIGFTFNQTYLQVTNVTDSGWLLSAGGTLLTALGYGDHGLASVDNATGTVTAVTEELTAGPYVSGSGAIVKVGFKIKSFAPPYTRPYPGGQVSMMQFSVVSGATTELILYSSDGTDITPYSSYYNGFFTLAVTPTSPTASFTMTPPSPNVYNNTNGLENFDASASTGGNSGYGSAQVSYYIWNFGDGSRLNTTNPKSSHTYAGAGTYTITLIVNNTVGMYSVPVSQTLLVEYSTKISAPVVTISPGSVTLDVGQSQTFTSTVSGGTSPYSYQWCLNGAAVSGATSSSWTFTPSSSGSYAVYLNVTDHAGLRAESNTGSVTVNLALSVSISPTSASIAPGHSQTFTSTVSGGTLPYSYQWYLNGVAQSGATGASWTFTSSTTGSYTVYVKVTDSASTPVTLQSNTAGITVSSGFTVVISPGSVTLDVGQSQTFTSTVSGGTSPYSYQWCLNGAAVSGATSSSWTFTPNSPDSCMIFVNVTDNSGLHAESNTALVTTNPALSVSISPTFAFVAPGHSQPFVSAVSGGTLPYSYQWYLNGSAESGATGASWTFTTSSASSDVVYLKVTDSILVQATSNTASVNDWWPMFHHDLTHTGDSTSTAPNANQTLWSYATGGGVSSSPTIANGMVFVGSGDGKVYALNAYTGAFVWSYATEGAVESSPAVANGMVFVGSDNGAIYALNSSTGVLVWSRSSGWEVESSPAVANGMVFVDCVSDPITGNGVVYALNAFTGALIWNSTTTILWLTKSSPAVAGGRVFIGAGNGRVYALNASTGKQLWNYTTGGAVESSPAVVGGVVYIGSGDNRTYALNAATGVLIWRFRTGGAVESSPAVAGGLVFVGSDDGRVYALGASTGVSMWDFPTHGAVESSPAVAGGLVFVGSDDGRVYALDASTGAFVWSYATGGAVESSPAVVGGLVYAGSRNGIVYAFGPPPYSVTVTAYSITDGAALNVQITMDGSLTSYRTPHTFTGLTGSHAFTVPGANGTQSFKQWNTGETGPTIIVVYGGTETAYYRTLLNFVDVSSAVGISGYKLVFKETLTNSFSSQETINYYWSFCVDKWNGVQWVATGMNGSSIHFTGYAILALTTEDLPYYVYLLNSCTMKFGDWLKVYYTFNWNYSGTGYSIACVTKLNVHPADIAGAIVTFPYLGSDGRVNLSDLVLIALNWQKSGILWTGNFDATDSAHRADINGNGTVNLKDLTVLDLNWMKTWTSTPPPG